MEAAPSKSTFQQPTPPEAGAPPKLTIERFADGGISCMRFAGTIDESFEGKKLASTVSGATLVLDLGQVTKISSFGIREWVDFVGAAGRQVQTVILVECAPKVVDQLNMVANFAGGGRVFSFYAPFRCDYCDSEHRVLLQVDKDHETIKSMKLAERPCPSCKESMYFDDDGATFFSYLIGQDKFELEPDVSAFLAAKLDYAVADVSRKLRVDKIIEGRITYLRLTGDLDRTFPRDKLAEGLEGVAIIDVASLGRIEPAGAAEWRSFVQMVAPLVDALYIVGVMPPFLEKLATKDDLGPKGQVVTLALPYACAACKTMSPQWIDVADSFEVLRFATAPELRCKDCKGPLHCVAGENLMTILPGLPKPAPAPGLATLIPALRERAIASRGSNRKSSTNLPPPESRVAAPRSSLLVPFLASLLAVVVVAIGYVVYQQITTTKPASGGVIAKSAEVKPAWVGAATPCVDTPDKGIACTGVSSMSSRQDDADDEASDAALDAIANAVAVRIADKRWRQVVVPIYESARSAKLASFDRDPSNTSARRDVREARRAVAAAIKATSGGAVPAAPTARYWEELDEPDGKRFIAYAQIAVGKTEVARMIDAYTQQTQALGATAVSMFPLVAWRYPHVERGAIVTSLGSGPLQEVGLAEQYVVLAVGGRDVTDAASFAKLAGDEHDQLADRGGTFRLKVQAGDGPAREFAQPIKGKPVEPPVPDHGTHGPRIPRDGGSGGVNTWDRYGGGKGSGRDDPSQ